LEGELAEKKLSLKFLAWLDEQFDACGSQAAFAREINMQKSTIHQWGKNEVGEISEESLAKLMRYMAQLPGVRKIIAASTSEVRSFVEDGIMPGADLSRVENMTQDGVLNWIALSPLASVAIVGKACADRMVTATQNPNAGSERVRKLILKKLQQAGLSEIGANEFCEGFYTASGDIARCDRWMRGLETIPKTALFTLAAALSEKIPQAISHEELLSIYSDQLIEIDD
jgi:hypothetical protein